MAYEPNMRAAAFRHRLAAEELMSGQRQDVAGYLFGIAAECGLKAMMQSVGMRPLPAAERQEDPFYAHFMELKSLILDSNEGRRHRDLRKYAENSAFMNFWDVSMRYSDGKSIDPRWVERWQADANSVLDEL